MPTECLQPTSAVVASLDVVDVPQAIIMHSFPNFVGPHDSVRYDNLQILDPFGDLFPGEPHCHLLSALAPDLSDSYRYLAMVDSWTHLLFSLALTSSK